jgi:Ribonuclease HI
MIYTNSDGGARGNPGPGAIGVIVREDGKILTKYQADVGKRVTNNVAEYEGLIKALELASKFTNKKVICVVDSELIVKQLLGEYRVKNRKLLELFRKVQRLQENFEKIEYKHAPREDNYQKIVDGLLNNELDKKFPYTYKKARYK